MSIFSLQLLIIIGFITGFIASSYKLQNTPRHIVSKSPISYWLGR
jgi:hypothetical protein